MTDTAYIYSGTRAKALESALLTETQIERLLGAKSINELHKVLHDTYLATYLATQDASWITHALDQSIMDAKKLLSSIAPTPELLEILWLKHDYHNLKTIVKSKQSELPQDQILSLCFYGGVYAPESLLKHYDEGKLHVLNHFFKDAVEKAASAHHIFEIDIAMNTYYFKSIHEIVQRYGSKDSFLQRFVKLQIDLFNLKAALRAKRIDTLAIGDFYVTGGTYQKKDLETTKQVLDQLPRFGGSKHWGSIIEDFTKHEDYAPLERAADEYVAQFVKDESINTFSIAPLVNYFIMLKSNAQIIGAIIVAKNTHISEKELRTILRRVYT